MKIAPYFLVLVLAQGRAHAVPFVVSVRDLGKESFTAKVRIDNEAGTMLKETEVRVPGSITADIPSGIVVRLRATATDRWSEERFVLVSDETGEVTIDLWPAAVIGGQFDARSSIRSIALEAQQAKESTIIGGNLPPLPQVRVNCPVERTGRWRCRLPAGSLDLAIRAEGFAPEYFWRKALPPSRVIDLGMIRLIRGASISGFVHVESASAASSRSAVTLTLRPMMPANSESPRIDLIARQVTTNTKGFFQISGVPPGAYVLTATSHGMGSEEREIEVLENVEAILREPIILTRKKILRVAVTPATDPWGQLWTVNLARLEGENFIRTIASTTLPADGRWKSEPLQKGKYRILISRRQGNWGSREVVVDDDLDVALELPLITTSGTLKLGGKPLEGFIWFGGEGSSLSVPVAVRSDGLFRTILPRPENDTWVPVQVVADRPKVLREISSLKLTVGGDGKARADIDIPETAVFGEVVDSAGNGVQSWITVSAGGPHGAILQLDTDEAGVFSIHGVAPGELTIAAEASGSATPRSTTLSITEGETSPRYVRLVVEPNVEVKGIIRASARGVPGATISYIPQQRGVFVIHRATTEMDGSFTFSAPPGTERVTAVVSAPGFARRLLSMDVSNTASVDVSQQYGRISIIAPESERTRGTVIVAIREGVWYRAAALRSAAGGRDRTTTEKTHLEIERMEPGIYSACRIAQHEASTTATPRMFDCVTGYLSPFGEVTLTLPALAN